MNLSCEAYKQRICVNLGIGEFDINAEISSDNQRNCESCDSVLGKVCKVGFAHCIVSYTVNVSGNNREVLQKIKTYSEDNCKIWPNVVKVSKFN